MRTSNKNCPLNKKNQPNNYNYNENENLEQHNRITTNNGPLYLDAYATIEQYETIDEDYLGEMTHQCKYCGSLNFEDEKINGEFSICCHKGKVNLPEFIEPPDNIKNLFIGSTEEAKNFREYIRNYNNALSFASMVSNLDPLMDKPGPYFFKVHGQVMHYTSKSLHPEENKKRSYSQLYILDSKTATEERMLHQANSNCKPQIMEKIDNYLTTVNPYYHAYKQMRQIELEEEEKAKSTGSQLPNIHMAFKKCNTDDRRRYNIPKIGEIAVVFTGEDGMPPTDIDFQVFPKNTDQYSLNKLNILSEHLDPMTYPLIHFNGEPGWRPGMEHNAEKRFLHFS